MYMLDFVTDAVEKISYAPSLGRDALPSDLRTTYASLIERLNHVSVREERGRQLLSEVTTAEIEVVLDPTFLLSPTKWIELADAPAMETPYALAYFLGNNDGHMRASEAFAARKGLPLVVVPKPTLAGLDATRSLPPEKCGPRQFLGLIANAEYVVTDSFHGIALSLILEKQFLAYDRFAPGDATSQSSRVANLLDIVDLSSRLVPHGAGLPNFNPIDYEAVTSRITAERTRSLLYLQNALIQTDVARPA
ncbi:hypothetical protein N803_01080 [Knoellia subterranea KCTC 19937]|uniref:Polysaccharide pyruvyl transferase domain-containing protein n=1 Tax=Knoellia subterranea KCTC 19937 TaxID=1385521 RepID=A0A0A0JQ60_9MICO|nr:hypothetical protein N803_01080 [Knoellia subterranea KCTC 19937]